MGQTALFAAHLDGLPSILRPFCVASSNTTSLPSFLKDPHQEILRNERYLLDLDEISGDVSAARRATEASDRAAFRQPSVEVVDQNDSDNEAGAEVLYIFNLYVLCYTYSLLKNFLSF
jgi:predicted secreted protein